MVSFEGLLLICPLRMMNRQSLFLVESQAWTRQSQACCRSLSVALLTTFWVPVVPFVSRVSLFSKLIFSFLFFFSEYFFQCAGGICSLWRYPVARWGWCVLRPLLHRERPGGPPGAGGWAVQHGECTGQSRSLASRWVELLVLWMWP